jgi:hypothetical protein
MHEPQESKVALWKVAVGERALVWGDGTTAFASKLP